MKHFFFVLTFAFAQISFAQPDPAPSIDVFIIKSEGKINYIYQGNKKDKNALIKTIKNLGRAMGKSLIVTLRIDSQISLSELHSQLRILKEAKIQNAKVIIIEKSGKAVIVPIKLNDLNFDFEEIMIEEPK